MVKKRSPSVHSKYLLIILFLGVLYVSFLIVQPFISAILMSMVLAYLLRPLYRLLNKYLKKEAVSAMIIAILIILLLAVPAALIGTKVTRDAQIFYVTIKQKISGMSFEECTEDKLSCKTINQFKELIQSPEIKYGFNTIFTKMSSFIVQKGSDFIISIPVFILNLFVTIFSTYYLLKEGPGLVDRAKKLIPINKKDQCEVFCRFQDMAHAIIYSQIVVAIIQGSLAGIAFWIVGIGSPIIWTIIMILLSILPFFGSSLVWFPASIYLIIVGYTSNDYITLWKGVGLMIFGLVIISTIDNLLRPKLIGDRTNVHPVLVLIGVLGGLALFGFIGFIIGPLILAALMMFIHIYEREKNVI